MIVTCPACATAHEFRNALLAPGDVRITCRSCGNRWIEIDAETVVDLTNRHDPKSLRRDTVDDVSDTDVQRLVSAAREARVHFTAQRQERAKRWRAWAGYAAFVIAPFLALAAVPELVVAQAPAALIAYEKLGITVNIYGLEIRRVAQQHGLIKGMRVLSVKGEIVNTTDHMQKIPWLRFALQDGAKKDVYHWTLNTESRPLQPGESTSFVTRIQAPPETAKDLQIRFAHSDEIGSTASP
jgi:predicted Zn finger-like uncharacterized protein